MLLTSVLEKIESKTKKSAVSLNRQEFELMFKMPFLVNYIEQNILMVLESFAPMG